MRFFIDDYFESEARIAAALENECAWRQNEYAFVIPTDETVAVVGTGNGIVSNVVFEDFYAPPELPAKERDAAKN